MSDYPGKLTREELEALEGDEPGAVSRLREAILGEEDPWWLYPGKVSDRLDGEFLPRAGEADAMFREYSPEAVADLKRQFEEAQANGTLKVPTLADLGAEVNPSGAIDLGSRWRPGKENKG